MSLTRREVIAGSAAVASTAIAPPVVSEWLAPDVFALEELHRLRRMAKAHQHGDTITNYYPNG